MKVLAESYLVKNMPDPPPPQRKNLITPEKSYPPPLNGLIPPKNRADCILNGQEPFFVSNVIQ